MPAPQVDIRATVGIDPKQMPRHVAIIMDGNGRWAQQRGMPRYRGHEAGGKNVRAVVTTSSRLGLECLTLYSFSLQNWNRPKEEVDFLMDLYAFHLQQERPTLMENDVRLVHVGRRDRLPAQVLDELDASVELTRNNQGTTMCLAMNYGSRTEIVDAVRRLAADAAAGRLAPESIDEATLSEALYTAGLPDPDLLIRTAGQMRISNFLLWQISYAEFYVTDVFWPEFTDAEYYRALRAFADRERRFGEVKARGANGKAE